VGNAIQPDGIAQRLDDGVLADDLAERLGSESAIDRLVRDCRDVLLGWFEGHR
jgi:hypothetical protein